MKQLLVLCALMTVARPVAADEPSRTFDDLRRLAAPIVFVRDTAGQETKGRLLQITDSSVILMTDGVTREIPQADVVRIDRHGDSVKNGAAIGAAIGVLLGTVAAVTYGKGAAGAAASIPLGALFYGAMGAGIDALITARTPLYFAPSPSAATASPAGSVRRVAFVVRKTW